MRNFRWYNFAKMLVGLIAATGIGIAAMMNRPWQSIVLGLLAGGFIGSAVQSKDGIWR